VAPLWFVWQQDAVYLSTRQGSRTWHNARRDPRISVVLDSGRAWSELAGVILEGVCELLPVDHSLVRDPVSAWHEKYRPMLAADGFERLAEAVPDLGFLRLEPTEVQTWDHAR
jgi:general stress protein 26